MKIRKQDAIWYDAIPVRKDTLGDTLEMLSGLASLSVTYTNCCIRHTTVNTLDEEGIEARHIMGTTGHQSESSIKCYAKTSFKQNAS